MSDYTNTFGGVVKDRNSQTILGADWDTEYDNIATMSATKMNLVGSAVDGDLIQFDGSSPAGGEASGIGSAPLDGLTGVVETQLDDLDNTLVGVADEYPVFTGNGLHFFDGSEAFATGIGMRNVITENSWQSVGDTSDGVVDYQAPSLDLVPDEARLIIGSIIFNTTVQTEDDLDITLEAWIASYGVTPSRTNANRIGYLHFAAADEGRWGLFSPCFIPLDADKRFQIYWTDNGAATNQIYNTALYFHGYVT